MFIYMYSDHRRVLKSLKSHFLKVLFFVKDLTVRLPYRKLIKATPVTILHYNFKIFTDILKCYSYQTKLLMQKLCSYDLA